MSSFYFAYLVNSYQFASRIVEKESDQPLILYLALNERRRNAEKCCLKVGQSLGASQTVNSLRKVIMPKC